jgi:hypothetical protein
MSENILATAILQMGRMKKGNSFCPSEVVRWIYPQDWSYFMEDVHKAMMELYRQGKIDVIQEGKRVDPSKLPSGPIRIFCKLLA